MRGFAAYLLGGILVVLALDFVAPPVGLGLAAGAWPAAQNAMPQSVNRANKADRMPVSASTVGKKIEKQTPRSPVLAGCDPVFSPLSASARANFAARCMA